MPTGGPVIISYDDVRSHLNLHLNSSLPLSELISTFDVRLWNFDNPYPNPNIHSINGHSTTTVTLTFAEVVKFDDNGVELSDDTVLPDVEDTLYTNSKPNPNSE